MKKLSKEPKVYTANGLRNYLNKKFKYKKSLEKFTDQDVQGYITRGKLPKYLGGSIIQESNVVEGVRTYKLSKSNEKDKVSK